MEVIICIAFVAFVLGRVLLGKDDGKPTTRPRHFVQHDDDEDGKYPPSYY